MTDTTQNDAQNKASSLTTAGVTVTAATLIPVVNWMLGEFRGPIPETVPYLIAAGLVSVTHLISNLIQARLKNNFTPPAPQPFEKATP